MVQSLSEEVPKYLYYAPRQTLYEVLFSVKIKDYHHWVDGLVYREVGKPNGQVYTRALNLFDSRWEIFYS